MVSILELGTDRLTAILKRVVACFDEISDAIFFKNKEQFLVIEEQVTNSVKTSGKRIDQAIEEEQGFFIREVQPLLQNEALKQQLFKHLVDLPLCL